MKWGNKKTRRVNDGFSNLEKNVRRRPTLPPSLPGSTLGAEGLSFRVRNETGRFPFAMAAETLWSYSLGRPIIDLALALRANLPTTPELHREHELK